MHEPNLSPLCAIISLEELDEKWRIVRNNVQKAKGVALARQFRLEDWDVFDTYFTNHDIIGFEKILDSNEGIFCIEIDLPFAYRAAHELIDDTYFDAVASAFAFILDCQCCLTFHAIREEELCIVYRACACRPVSPVGKLESPAEALFWRAWTPYALAYPLECQHRIGRYRVDFAHLLSSVVIEIDGLKGHSSPRDIAYDRRREREIRRRGWEVIRFGGSEIYHHAASCAREVYDLIGQRIGRHVPLF